MQSSSVSEVDEEHTSQHHPTWRQFSGLYLEDVRGADCNATSSDRQQAADGDKNNGMGGNLVSTENAELAENSQLMQSDVSDDNGQDTSKQHTTWQHFSGLYRGDVRVADGNLSLSNMDLPATARRHADKTMADRHF